MNNKLLIKLSNAFIYFVDIGFTYISPDSLEDSPTTTSHEKDETDYEDSRFKVNN